MVLAGLLEVILAMAIVGTAVALYPVAKRYNESIALGYVGLRTLEAGVITVGIVSLLAVVTLRQDVAAVAAGADAASLLALSASLVAVHDLTFAVGPNFVLAINTVLMAYLMFRSRLVPRFIGTLGLVGGPLIFAWTTGSMFGLYEHDAPLSALVVIPVFAREVSLAVRLIVKGFNPTPYTSDPAAEGVPQSAQ